MSHHPPRLAGWILMAWLPGDVREATLGDMEETFAALADAHGASRARTWYWAQVLRSLNPLVRWSGRLGFDHSKRNKPRQRGRPDMIRGIWRDVKFGGRTAIRSPGFTAVVVLTLGLGIGANTAIFSVVDTILLRPLPFPEPNRLVTVWADYSERGGPLREWLSFPNFHDLRQENEVFDEVAAWFGWNPTLTTAGDAEVLVGAQFSSGMFSRVLGTTPTMGRGFTPEDDQPGSPNVVLLSHGLWSRRFGGDPDILGRTVVLNDVPNTVIGVMPAGFRPPFVPAADIWKPFQMNETAFAGSRGDAMYRSFARLAPDVSLVAARARATDLGTRLAQEYPGANTGVGYSLFTMQEDLVRQTRAPLWVLLGAVAFVLLIACVNVANLLLARATARQSELAVRAAIGAGGNRLARQLFTESCVLAVLGGVLGAALAVVGIRAMVAVAPAGTPRIEEVALDVRILLFAGLVTGLSTLVFGLLPAIRAARTDLHDALKAGGRGTDAGGRGRGLRSALVVGQVALALMLLVGAGLMIRSLRALNSVDLGFEPQGMLALQLNLPPTRYPDRAATASFFRDLETRLAVLPGVKSVGSINALPLAGNNMDVTFAVEGRPPPQPGQETVLWFRRVTPRYFDAMEIELLSGRGFSPNEDREATPTLVVNQTMADRIFPNETPIGKRINVNSRDNPVWREIVGVARDVKNFGVQQGSRNAAYFPYYQLPSGFMSVVVKTAGDPTGLVASVRRAIGELDPALGVANVTTMEDLVRVSLASDRFVTILLTLFAAVALVLAVVGLYGVVSYGVNQRVREMGVRIALGAGSTDIRRLVVGKSVLLAGVGVLVGVVGAIALTRVMEGLLFGVSATDPMTFGATAILLTVVAAIASSLPAQRAVRVDPMAVLRNE